MRRQALCALIIVLFLANVTFFVVKLGRNNALDQKASHGVEIEEVESGWVAFMPELEASQRADPIQFGYFWDGPIRPPPVASTVLVDGSAVSALSMIAGQCGLEQYSIRNKNDNLFWMPERLFAQHLSSDQQQCLMDGLPEGYQISQLNSPVMPSQVPWSLDLSGLGAKELPKASVN